MTDNLNHTCGPQFQRPMFRKAHSKRVIVERWCDENGIDRAAIRTVMLHPVYGFGQGGPKYVVDWQP
jgi:hypothetical protein